WPQSPDRGPTGRRAQARDGVYQHAGAGVTHPRDQGAESHHRSSEVERRIASWSGLTLQHVSLSSIRECRNARPDPAPTSRYLGNDWRSWTRLPWGSFKVAIRTVP